APRVREGEGLVGVGHFHRFPLPRFALPSPAPRGQVRLSSALGGPSTSLGMTGLLVVVVVVVARAIGVWVDAFAAPPPRGRQAREGRRGVYELSTTCAVRSLDFARDDRGVGRGRGRFVIPSEVEGSPSAP